MHLLALLNWMKWVFWKFKNNIFDVNHLIICAKTVLRSLYNWLPLGLVIKLLVSSANKIGRALCLTVLGKSFMCNRKSRGPKIEPCGTPHFILVHFEIVSVKSELVMRTLWYLFWRVTLIYNAFSKTFEKEFNSDMGPVISWIHFVSFLVFFCTIAAPPLEDFVIVWIPAATYVVNCATYRAQCPAL